MSTNLHRSQWIDLGNHPEACMTQGNCNNGALSFWVNPTECINADGIISSYSNSRSRGFYIFCMHGGNIGYDSFTNINLFFCTLNLLFLQLPIKTLFRFLPRGVWLVIFKCLIITRYFLLIFLLFSITTVGWKVLLVNK